jgi:uncharacterized protein
MKMTIDNVSSNPQLLTIVPVYAAFFGLMLVYLSFRVIKQRRSTMVSLGDGDDPTLRKAIAVHSNFSQYVPLALLLITFVELNHASAYLVHGLCAALLIGRIAHAYGLAQPNQIMKLRRLGMVLTFSAIIIAALYLLGSAI